MSGKTTLYRTTGPKIGPKTVIFAGNGIFQNGWDPLERAIKEHSDQYGYFLDNEIFLLRIVEEFRLLIKNRIEINRDARSTIFRTNIQKLKWPEQSVKFRNSIARAYKEAGSLKFRNIPKYIEEKLRGNTRVVTSNWDQTLWDYSENFSICHIHGRCQFPESLIFPTEYIRDIADNHITLWRTNQGLLIKKI